MGKILLGESQVYEEFLLQPKFQSKESMIEQIDLSAPFAKFNYNADKPWAEQTPHRFKRALMCAPMQAVGGDLMAEALAQQGCGGTIFGSQPVEKQVEMIEKVKRVKGGFVVPDVIPPEMYIGDVIELSKKSKHGRYPVTESGKPHAKLVGYLDDELFTEAHKGMRVRDRMIRNLSTGENGWNYDRLERYVASEDEIGDRMTALSTANKLMEDRARSRILLIVDNDYNLKSAVFKRDFDTHKKYSATELVDSQKRYKVGASINTRDYKDRAPACIKAGADWLIAEAAQAHNGWMKEALQWLRNEYGPDHPIIAGNVVTAEGFRDLVEWGASAVKIGVGPGSICISRQRFAGGKGQATAVKDVADARDIYFQQTGGEKGGIYVPVIADGGASNISHFIISWGLGADMLMCGQYFAGFKESPTDLETIEVETKDGKKFNVTAKPYWGEASPRAKEWRGLKYSQDEFDEGVDDSYVPFKGSVAERLPKNLREAQAGIHKWGYTGIRDLNVNAELMHQTEGSRREGGPTIYRLGK